MAKAEVKFEIGTLHVYPVTNAVNFQLFLEALADAHYHVAHQRAHQSVLGAVNGFVILSGNDSLAICHCNGNARHRKLLERTLRAGHSYEIGVDSDCHTAGNGDGQFSYATHRFLLNIPYKLTRRRRLAFWLRCQSSDLLRC